MSERDFFAARINDLICREELGESMVYSSFLTAEEAATAHSICQKRGARHLLYGGYDESERKMLAISSYEPDLLKQCFPIVLLEIKSANVSDISNRDVLGALMGAGIRREMLGDIIVRSGIGAFFASEQIVDFLIQNIESIGRYKVQLTVAPECYEIPKPNFEYSRLTAASLRIDAVVSSLAHISRDRASELIADKLVQLNHLPLEKKTKEIHAGDCLVIRGFGKWIIDECGELSKKGRTVLHCRKYI